jgi:hypothetical protein
MKSLRAGVASGLAFALTLSFAGAALAQPVQQPIDGRAEVMFPMAPPGKPQLKPQSGWRITYKIYPLSSDVEQPAVNPYGGSRVWRITGVEFMRGYKDAAGTQPDWIRVLDDLVLTDMHVPYNDGQTEFHDISDLSFGFVRPGASNLPEIGCYDCSVLPDLLVAKEVVDDGIRWTSRLGGDGAGEYDSQNEPVRRGQVMWLWTNLAAGNYRYLVKYGFADDGTIRARVGGTAQNLPSFDAPLENGQVPPGTAPTRDKSPAVHLHTGFWRMQFNLGDPERLHVHVAERITTPKNKPEAPAQAGATSQMRDFNSGYEGGEVWNPNKFTAIKIMSTVTRNRHNPPVASGYGLMPMGSGIGRTERRYTHRDFWLTRAAPDNPRRRWPRGTVRYEAKYKQLPERIAISRPANPPAGLRNEPFLGEKTGGKAVVLWHQAGLNHIPRSEDFGQNGFVADEGTAIVHWAGFDLMPHNLWHKTPFFEPPAP